MKSVKISRKRRAKKAKAALRVVDLETEIHLCLHDTLDPYYESLFDGLLPTLDTEDYTWNLDTVKYEWITKTKTKRSANVRK